MRVFLGLTFLVLVFPIVTSAATLYMDPPAANLNRGDSITINVRLDTDEAIGECINAVDGVITYTDNIIPADISVGESIFPVWVEVPTIDKEHHQITFAGGIPNGYCGRVEGDPRLTNTLLQLVFRVPGLQVGGKDTTKTAVISFASNTAMYLNDGAGTIVPATTLGATLELADTVGREIKDDWKNVIADDIYPPEEFSISLEKDDHAFDQKNYIVFNTTDKQSGVSHYEVIEETTAETSLFGFGAATAPWKEVRSPYVLSDQTLHSTVRVRAIDKAGNEYIAILAPKNTAPTKLSQILDGLQRFGLTPYMLLSVALALFFAGVALVTWYFWRRHKRKGQVQSEVVITNENV